MVNITGFCKDDVSILEKIKNIKKDSKYSIEPNLPIDLISIEKIEEKTEKGEKELCVYYTIYFIVSSKNIPDTLEHRIIFYKFYLSRIISTKRFKIVLISKDYPKDISRLFTNKVNGLKENGIGLWVLDSLTDSFVEKYPSLSHREVMESEFKSQKPEDILLFFDKYIHNSVGSIAGIQPSQFGNRYLDRKAIDNIYNLKSISYLDDLVELLNELLTEKGNEYEFSAKAFSKLWKSHIGLDYTNFLERFEPSLQYIFAESRDKKGNVYRDHYLHQFQVFLLGLTIIDKFYPVFKKHYVDPEICWLITSSFHDIAYPVQLYDKWSEKFFLKAFNIKRNPSFCEFRDHFIDEEFHSCIGYLICRLCEKHLGRKLQNNWLASENDYFQLFYQQITEKKNHGVMSCISLLKMIHDEKNKTILNGNFEKYLEERFVPSALAIALHDYHVWSQIWNVESTKIGEPISKSLNFDDDPLSFLLIFCDNIQEWGRPSKTYKADGENDDDTIKEKRFYLKEFVCSDTEVKVTLWTPVYSKNETFFKAKQKEFQMVQNFLKQPPKIKFLIRLEDKSGKGEDFEMEGSTI